MPTDPASIQVELMPRLKHDLRDLTKRYRQIRYAEVIEAMIKQYKQQILPPDHCYWADWATRSLKPCRSVERIVAPDIENPAKSVK